MLICVTFFSLTLQTAAFLLTIVPYDPLVEGTGDGGISLVAGC